MEEEELKRINKRTFALLWSLIITLVLSGCGKEVVTYPGFMDLTPDGIVNYETAEPYTAIDATDPNLLSKLTDGMFYVLHNGKYYQTYYYGFNNVEFTDSVNRGRQAYFTTENEIYIPTLFLGNGDKLIYYAKNNVLDFITWERFYNLGYTLPIASLYTLTNGKVCIDLTVDESEAVSILPNCELRELNDMANADSDGNIKYMLIDKINNNPVDYTMLSSLEEPTDSYSATYSPHDYYSDKIIDSSVLNKGEIYDLEIYNGTNFLHYTTTASMLTLRSYELYRTIDYTCLRDYLYEIDIPDFFENGFYNVNGMGFIRLIKEDSYSDATDYNVQVLFPPVESGDVEGAWKSTRVYSPYPPLNLFTTNIEGKLGYVNPNQSKVSEDAPIEDKLKSLTRASIKTIDLWLPVDKDCTIEITSPKSEKTGTVILEGTSTYKKSEYNRMSNNYLITCKGTGERVTLTISGFWYSYNISLTNAEIYNNQDVIVKTTTPGAEEKSTSEEKGNIFDTITGLFNKGE